MKKLWLLAVSYVVFFPVAAHSTDTFIIAFGDSITKGHCRDECNGYPDQLSLMLNRTAIVINSGKGGEQTKDGIVRLRGLLGGDFSSTNPCYSVQQYNGIKADFVLIMEGANDVIRGVSPLAVKFNLGQMIDNARAAHVTPILATLTSNTADTYGFGPCNGSIIGPYNQAIRTLAVQKNVILADQCNATVNKWTSLTCDGLHPTLDGDTIIAATWYSILPFVPEEVKGDIDGDGQVTLADAVTGLQLLSGTPSGSLHWGADIDGDHKIGIAEIVHALRTSGEM